MIKYEPKGRPLSPVEKELIGILTEECCEVAIAVSKVTRFGLGDVNPTTGTDNQIELSLEIGDLKAMIAIVEGMGLTNPTYVSAGVGRKHDKLLEFVQSDADGLLRALKGIDPR